MPMAAARDKLFPTFFAKTNNKGIPIISIIVSSVLISIMMAMNFSRSLAETYRYMILLSTLTSLLAYSFSIPSYLIILVKDKKLQTTQWVRFVIAIVAFVFSMWAIIGSGETIVYWGFVLLMAGVPFYALMKLKQA